MLNLVDCSLNSILDKVVSLMLDDRHCFSSLSLNSTNFTLSPLFLQFSCLEFSEVGLLKVFYFLSVLGFKCSDSGYSSCLRGFDGLFGGGVSSFLRQN